MALQCCVLIFHLLCVQGLSIDEDANMPTCNLSKIIHNTWLQQSRKKGKDIFNATFDDLIKALKQYTHYRMHLIKPNYD